MLVSFQLCNSITKEQLRLLRKYKRIIFIFDPETEAFKKAEKAGSELAMFGCESEIISLDEGDPADLVYEEARELKKELI